METRRGVLTKATIGALALFVGPNHVFSSYMSGDTNSADDSGKGYLVRVNCAGPAVDGFLEDQPYRRGSWGYSRGGQLFACDAVANDYGMPTAIKTLRYACGAPFHYKFSVPNGIYRVKMYFASPNEFYGPRTFDVVLNGKLVLPNYRPTFGRMRGHVIVQDLAAPDLHHHKYVEHSKSGVTATRKSYATRHSA